MKSEAKTPLNADVKGLISSLDQNEDAQRKIKIYLETLLSENYEPRKTDLKLIKAIQKAGKKKDKKPPGIVAGFFIFILSGILFAMVGGLIGMIVFPILSYLILGFIHPWLIEVWAGLIIGSILGLKRGLSRVWDSKTVRNYKLYKKYQNYIDSIINKPGVINHIN